jgi:hypothetical protein
LLLVGLVVVAWVEVGLEDLGRAQVLGLPQEVHTQLRSGPVALFQQAVQKVVLVGILPLLAHQLVKVRLAQGQTP